MTKTVPAGGSRRGNRSPWIDGDSMTREDAGPIAERKADRFWSAPVGTSPARASRATGPKSRDEAVPQAQPRKEEVSDLDALDDASDAARRVSKKSDRFRSAPMSAPGRGISGFAGTMSGVLESRDWQSRVDFSPSPEASSKSCAAGLSIATSAARLATSVSPSRAWLRPHEGRDPLSRSLGGADASRGGVRGTISSSALWAPRAP